MRTLSCIICVALLLTIGMVVAVLAAPPRPISYQGYLKNGAGTPVSGSVIMTLRLYDTATKGTTLWEEKRDVPVTNGLYQINLGEITPFNLPFDQQYWLGITVNGDPEMQPRQQLQHSPYAFRSTIADTIPDKTVTAAKIGQVCADGEVLRYDSKSSSWLCAPGTPGPAGPQGIPGATGPAGPAGPTGSGIRWRGPFDPLGVAYPANDVVQFDGKAWIAATVIPKVCEIFSLGGGCFRYGLNWVAPGSDAAWQLFSSGGVGPTGPQGAPGPAGPNGPVGPQGTQGPAGPQGTQGPAGPLPPVLMTRIDYPMDSANIPFCYGFYSSSCDLSVGHISLPAGQFVVTYTIFLNNYNNYVLQDNSRYIVCRTQDGGEVSHYIPSVSPGPATHSISATFDCNTHNSPYLLNIKCYAGDYTIPEGTPSGVAVSTIKIIAIQVGSITLQTP